MARFTLPRDIYFGPGAMKELAVLGKSRKHAFVVTGGHSMQKSGALDRLCKILADAGLQVTQFTGVEPDPSVETVMKGAQAMRDCQPDVIVAIGGGSPIDAAKAMWVFYEHPEKTFDDIKDPFTPEGHLRGHPLHLRHRHRGHRLLRHHGLLHQGEIPPRRL